MECDFLLNWEDSNGFSRARWVYNGWLVDPDLGKEYELLGYELAEVRSNWFVVQSIEKSTLNYIVKVKLVEKISLSERTRFPQFDSVLNWVIYGT